MTLANATTAPAPEPIPTVLRHCVTGATIDALLPPDWTVEQAAREIARAIQLPETNAENEAQVYELFAHRADGRAQRLRPSARLREAIEPGTEIEPLPEVVPGMAGTRG